MRTLLLSALLAALTGGGWAVVDGGQGSGAVYEPTRLAEARDRIGLRRMLAAGEMDLTNLVIGRAHSGDLRDFRGRTARDGRTRPVYGQARRLCLKGQDDPACWEIAHLEIDGRAVSRRAVTRAEIPEPAAHPAPRAPLPPALHMPADPAATIPPAAGPPPATHRVARAVINLRAGPGTDRPVVGKLNAGAELALIERREDWGRFVVLGAGTGAEPAWAALRILEPLH